MKYYKYHGKARHTQPSLFQDYDIVLTTYGTIAADFGSRRKMIGSMHWYRIILDEGKLLDPAQCNSSHRYVPDSYCSAAHIIRNPSTKVFKAVQTVPAQIRWCMTGTPIQNRLGDLGALIRFLRTPIMGETDVFRRYICAEVEVSKLKKNKKPDYSNLRLLLGSICLRRAQSIMDFHSTTITIRPEFTKDERAEYSTLEVVCRQALTTAVSKKLSKASHQHVLEKLLRLREFCNGIKEGPKSSPEAVLASMYQREEAHCTYCSVDITELSAAEGVSQVKLTECQRFVCSDLDCTLRYWEDLKREAGGNVVCPFCHVQHRTENILAVSGETTADEVQPLNTPSKLLALLEDIEKHMAQEKRYVVDSMSDLKLSPNLRLVSSSQCGREVWIWLSLSSRHMAYATAELTAPCQRQTKGRRFF